MLIKRSIAVIGFAVVMLSSCDRYRVTLNEHPVYEPAPLFSDFNIADHSLFTCVQQTIEDQGITAAEQLKALSCSHAGIASLQGLQRFDHIEVLNVRHNAISDIALLQQLPHLKILDLSSNAIKSVTALLALPNVETIDLKDNPGLICVEGLALARTVRDVNLPSHCRP